MTASSDRISAVTTKPANKLALGCLEKTLALTLLVTRLCRTNNPQYTVAPNHLAVAAHFFNRCTNFHDPTPTPDLTIVAAVETLSVRLLHQRFVMMRHQVCLHLDQKVHS